MGRELQVKFILHDFLAVSSASAAGQERNQPKGRNGRHRFSPPVAQRGEAGFSGRRNKGWRIDQRNDFAGTKFFISKFLALPYRVQPYRHIYIAQARDFHHT
jgi:hypothetical protein